MAKWSASCPQATGSRSAAAGVRVPALANPIYYTLVAAIEERTREFGYEVLLAQSADIPEREESCIRRFLSRRVDGLFLMPVYRMATEARIYQELLTRRIPVV